MERASPHRLVMEILVPGNIIVSRVSLGISRQLVSSTKVGQYEHVPRLKALHATGMIGIGLPAARLSSPDI